LPGQELLQYLDEQGQVQDIDSGDVNEYLREISGQDFTAKDFRTWAGTVLCAVALDELGDCPSSKQAKKNIVRAVEQVAEQLGNTPAVCRKSYIHPAVMQAYLDGALISSLAQRIENELDDRHGLRDEERSVVRFLQERMEQEAAG
jgi:DNA topoisomerase-1